MKILITGISGFVGLPLSEYLTAAGHQVLGVVRSSNQFTSINTKVQVKMIGDIDGTTDWYDCLDGVDCIIHLANRAHVVDEKTSNSSALYEKVNVDGTLNLARQAASSGVKRFIFLSSIKAIGESTFQGQHLTSFDQEISTDPYGLSKYKAELGLRLISEQAGLELVVIRSPLIYGPRVKANFLKMMQWVDKGVPLPFGSVHNKRSMIGLDNLINFIELCLKNSNATGQILFVSDDHDVSTSELLKEIAASMQRRSMLLSMPQSFLENILIYLGQRYIAERLCRSLQLDISLTKTKLSWKPPYDFKNQLNKTVVDYLSRRKE